jgi:SAM-dependent methyltransferase
MARDRHLQTGEYEPRSYWDARAGEEDELRAVCGFGRSPAENLAMHRVQAAVLGACLRRLPLEGGEVLELGCGVGRWVPFFNRRGARYAGVDVSPEMVRRARERHPDAAFEQLDGTRLPFADGRFDLATSITVLHHNPHDRQLELVAELVRVTKPGGHVLLLEAISREEEAHPSFNMFPRPIDGWIRAFPPGAVEVVASRPARWWIVRDLCDAALRPLVRRRRPPSAGEPDAAAASDADAAPRRLGAAGRLLVGLGARVDPWLVHWLPAPLAAAVALLVQRR